MSKTVILKSSDGVDFEVEEAVATQSETIKQLMEEDCSGFIPVPNVDSRSLQMVTEYCNKHVKTGKEDDDDVKKDEKLKEWDEKFMDIDTNMLYDLILAANFLNIPGLLDLTTTKAANMIKGKTPEEIRKTFNISNDVTPEEEAEVRKDNQWASEWFYMV